MKYLKKYNERLSPEVYKRAGDRLVSLGKEKRGYGLIDHYNKISGGYFNIVHASKTAASIFNGFDMVVSRPKTEFYFGGLDLTYNDAEELINGWSRGESELRFTIRLYFHYFTGDTKHSQKTYNEGEKIIFGDFNFILSDSLSGIEKGDDVYDFFKATSYEIYDIYLSSISGIGEKVSLFTDRKSALKFKKILNDLFMEYKSNMIEIFSILGADTKDWEKMEESISKISINQLYIEFDKQEIIKTGTSRYLHDVINRILVDPLN